MKYLTIQFEYCIVSIRKSNKKKIDTKNNEKN